MALGVRRLSGGLFQGGFEMVTRHLDQGLEIHATDDETPMDVTHEVVNPTGGRVVPLTTRRAPELEQRFLKVFHGSAPAADLASLRTVRRLAAVIDGTPVFANQLEGTLVIADVDRFEAQLGMRLRNMSSPRDTYLT
jgi:hypothetical protein